MIPVDFLPHETPECPGTWAVRLTLRGNVYRCSFCGREHPSAGVMPYCAAERENWMGRLLMDLTHAGRRLAKQNGPVFNRLHGRVP